MQGRRAVERVQPLSQSNRTSFTEYQPSERSKYIHTWEKWRADLGELHVKWRWKCWGKGIARPSRYWSTRTRTAPRLFQLGGRHCYFALSIRRPVSYSADVLGSMLAACWPLCYSVCCVPLPSLDRLTTACFHFCLRSPLLLLPSYMNCEKYSSVLETLNQVPFFINTPGLFYSWIYQLWAKIWVGAMLSGSRAIYWSLMHSLAYLH